jgi:raffinose/stachyose/melibiose transport system substrate-binding protein
VTRPWHSPGVHGGRKSALLVVAVAAAGLGSLTGGATSAAAPTDEHVTLRLVDVETSDGPVASIAGMIKAFERLHPNIKIESSVVPYANYRTTVKLQASSPNAPDIIEGDMGPGGVVSSLAQADLLAPLDRQATAGGWNTIFRPLARQLHLPTSGKGVGEGPIWGVPAFGEILGVHYNKALLAKIGAQVPASFAAFEKTLADAKVAGITPIMIGGLDKWPWSHFYDLLADHYGSPAGLTKWFDGRPGATIDTPGMRTAGDKLQEWYAKGYFEQGANGVSDADAVAKFTHGSALYKVDGPWATATYQKGLGNKLGFFLLPPQTAGAAPASTGWLGWAFAVSKASKHREAAIAFLDFMASPQARAITLRTGTLPAAPGNAAGVKAGSALASIVAAYSATITSGALVPYMDVAYLQVAPHDMDANAQSLAAGKMSPKAFLANQQAASLAFYK